MYPQERYTVKGGRRLRCGYTTGSCAAAAARAAAELLLAGQGMQAVQLQTPAGVSLLLAVEQSTLLPSGARCAVRKDAGDDPDTTDGALVYCTVSKILTGIEIDGGEGVGRVSKPGLACAVGEAAINPVPRRMIADQLRLAATENGYTGGLRAVVEVPQGRVLASQTFNPRLGIEGGISILGTTGIVEPMSEAALLATIHTEIDSLAAQGRRALLMVPGNYGETFARTQWGLSLESGVKCSNYIGDTLDYAVYKGFHTILLLGHAGKLVKLAAGVMNTHSRVADARMQTIAAHCALQGVPPAHIAAILGCVSVDAADALLVAWDIADAVWSGIAADTARQLAHRTGEEVRVEFAAFGARGILFRSSGVEKCIGEALA